METFLCLEQKRVELGFPQSSLKPTCGAASPKDQYGPHRPIRRPRPSPSCHVSAATGASACSSAQSPGEPMSQARCGYNAVTNRSDACAACFMNARSWRIPSVPVPTSNGSKGSGPEIQTETRPCPGLMNILPGGGMAGVSGRNDDVPSRTGRRGEQCEALLSRARTWRSRRLYGRGRQRVAIIIVEMAADTIDHVRNLFVAHHAAERWHAVLHAEDDAQHVSAEARFWVLGKRRVGAGAKRAPLASGW